MAKGRVTIDEVICKGCGLCVSVCPKNVLALSTNGERRLYRLHKLRENVP